MSSNSILYVHPSGQKILINDLIFKITDVKEEVSTKETPLKFNQPYVVEMEGLKYEFVFHEDGASEIYMSENGLYVFGGVNQKHTNRYDGTEMYIPYFMSNATISEDGTEIIVPNGNGSQPAILTLVPTPVKDIELNTTWAERDGMSGEYFAASPIKIDSGLKLTIIYDNVVCDTIQLENHGYYMSGMSNMNEAVKIVKHPDGTKMVSMNTIYQQMLWPPYEVTPSAKFSDGTILTWQELMNPTNGATYGYNANAIGATSIGEGAFENCTQLVSITLPEEVTIISKNAFFNCTSLTEITLSNKVVKFDFGCFKKCSSLTRFNYNGYKEEWKWISREVGSSSDFDQNSAHYTTYCIDGTFDKYDPR